MQKILGTSPDRTVLRNFSLVINKRVVQSRITEC